ncbi:MAG: hypothetical protein GYB31_00625 [Bacteroidetes bacterium]|nr:hypothetical protein [Bacteroidota bacterium]
MKAFAIQLKWQFLLLGKNNIISISLAVTLIYGLILFFLRHIEGLDKLLVALVLNDPSVIGYFFIALAVITEIKAGILPALFVSPLEISNYINSRVLALSIIGLICALGLAFFVKGLDFNILYYSLGNMGICLFCALLAIFMLGYSTDFLQFALNSIPIFLAIVNLPMLNYLNVISAGYLTYLSPIQPGLDLIQASLGDPVSTPIWLSLLLMVFWIGLFHYLAIKRFKQKIVRR